MGLGNIWKFPYITGENGGGAFLIVYLICVAAIGLPIMLAEFALGRKSGKDIVGAYTSLRKGPLWAAVGWMGIVAGFVILSFYGVVAGWTIAYTVKSITSTVTQFHDPKEAGEFFGAFVSNTWEVLFYQFVFIFLCASIVTRGIKSGIERWCGILMPSLVVILVLLMVRAVTLPGALEGVAFFLYPDFSKLTPHSILVALGHAFFSLSIGMGAMVTYGSYLDRNHNLASSALLISLMDTAIAVLAGMVIFPAVFAMGLEPASGPGLVFHVLPKVFSDMHFGPFFSTAFFALLAIAALTSGISLLEVVVAYLIDELGWKRKKAVIIISMAVFVIGIPSNVSCGLLSDTKLFGLTFFDMADTLASNYLLPLGGLFLCIFIGWVWGIEEADNEVQKGCSGFVAHFATIWSFLIRYVSPVAVTIILVAKLL